MLVDNESSQLVVLRALYDVWKNHQQVNKIKYNFIFQVLFNFAKNLKDGNCSGRQNAQNTNCRMFVGNQMDIFR
jgi:hypothetical protein